MVTSAELPGSAPAHRTGVLTRLFCISLSKTNLERSGEDHGRQLPAGQRIRRRRQEGGLEATCHGNRGRRVSHVLTDSGAAVIVAIHEHVDKNFNDKHVTEMLAEHEGIFHSRETGRKDLRSTGSEPKRKRRTTRRQARRPRKSQAGIMMQGDGSPHPWFGPDHEPQTKTGRQTS